MLLALSFGAGCGAFARSTAPRERSPWEDARPGEPITADPGVLAELGDARVQQSQRPAPRVVRDAVAVAGGAAVAVEVASREGRFELGEFGENFGTDAYTEVWLRLEEATVLARLAVAPSPAPVYASVELQRRAAGGNVPPGELHLHVPGTAETHRVRVFDTSGRMRPDAVREVSWALRDRRANRARTVEPRLITMLYLVGQYYDAQLEVVSGYRIRGVNASEGSRHGAGAACDFRIHGVNTMELVRYLDGTFANAGVGYYPTSGFVHLDSRRPSYYWIDRSGPGQRSRTRSRTAEGRADPSRDVTLRSVHVTEVELYIPPPAVE